MTKTLRWLLFLLLPLPALAQLPSDYKLDKLLGTPLNTPQDVVADAQGRLNVLDSGYLMVLDSQGVYQRRLLVKSPDPTKNASNGNALALDAAGNFYVGDDKYREVRKFSPEGKLLVTFGVAGKLPGQLDGLRKLALDAAGNVYIVDAHRLQKFNGQGQFQWQFTPTTYSYGDLALPVDVEVGTDGRLFLAQSDFGVLELDPGTGSALPFAIQPSGISNTYNGSLARDAAGNFYLRNPNGGPVPIYKYSPQGIYQGGFGYTLFDYSSATALTVDARGNIYATNYPEPLARTSKLYKFNAAGQEVGRWGKLTTIQSVVFDREDNYVVVDSNLQQVIKYSAAGQELLRFGGYGTQPGQFSQGITGVAIDDQLNFYVLERKNNTIRIQKFSANGTFLKLFEVDNPNSNSSYLPSLAVDPVGCLYVVDYFRAVVIKLSPQGLKLLEFGGYGTQPGHFNAPAQVAVDGRGFVYVADQTGKRVQKFSPTGQFLQEHSTGPLVREFPIGLSVTADGTVFLSNAADNVVQVFDPSGQYNRQLPGPFSYVGQVAVNRRGTRLLLVEMYSDLVSSYVATTPPRQANSQIQGRIFQDVNRDCVAQAAEPGLAGIVVVAEPGHYYGLSDENGRYSIAADTGTYTIQQLLPQEAGRAVQQSCAGSPAAVRVASYGTTLAGPDFSDDVATAPYLRVQLGSSRRRRCFRSTTTVSYSNTGYAPAVNATVTVALPPQVAFISATMPHTRDANGNYVFQLGTLAPFSGGSLFIQDSVVCGDPTIRGLTVCTKAWIAPANTYPTPPGGNEAAVRVSGTAQAGNQVRFVVRNATAAGMADSLGLRLYQNSELALQHRYQLAAGDSLVLRVPATRPVVRLEADQPAGHPTQRQASATVEVRALSSAGQANSAMLALPPNEPRPEVAEDCQPIVDSYDPNDKQVVPTGVTAQHYTPTGVPLHYRVRFQNTGSDDAYRVQVVDTLAADLDLRTLRVGAASHPFQLAVAGRGRPVLTFTFSNINLPPSTRNEADSNGFVEFSIQPKVGLPAKALLENAADIFFDFNPPVRTNLTTNRLYDLPLAVVPAVALAYADVLASPAVLQVVPAQGRAGTLVTLTGQRFGATTAANAVRFNGVAAPVLSATATTLTVRVPVAASTGTIQVVTSEGAGRSAQPFVVYQAPTLTAITPAEGTPGSLVTLTGSHFAVASAQDTVWFGSQPAVVQQASATMLQVVVPSGAQTGKISLSTLGGRTESPQAFTVWYPPAIAGFSPARGKAGDIITLTGSNFAVAARSEVAFGAGAAAVVQATGTSLRVRVPASAQTGLIRLQTPGGTAVSAAPFVFLPAPTINSFTPAQASVGEVLTLHGTNFLVDGLPDTLYVGGVRAAVLAASPTTATIHVPKGAVSGPLTAAGVGGRSQSATAFTVRSLPAAEAITVYPNPAHGVATLDWQRADFTLERVQVYNALGSLVLSVDLSQATATSIPVAFSAGQTGLFVLVVQTSVGTVRKQLVVY